MIDFFEMGVIGDLNFFLMIFNFVLVASLIGRVIVEECNVVFRTYKRRPVIVRSEMFALLKLLPN